MSCTEQPNNLIIIRAILAMGQSLGITIVAEGVETQEQFNILREYGAYEARGYYFSKPVRPEEFLALLKRKEL